MTGVVDPPLMTRCVSIRRRDAVTAAQMQKQYEEIRQ